MAVRKDEVNLQITIGAQQAGSTLRDLKKEARDIRRALERIPVGTKEFEDARAKLKAVTDQIAAAEGKMKQVVQQTGFWQRALAGAVGVFGGLSLDGIVNQLLTFAQRLFQVGVSLDTSAAKTRTVFGEAEGIVRGFAEANARDLGLAQKEYVKLATAAGDLLKPMGFTEDQVARLSVALTDQAGVLAEWSEGKVNTVQAQEILTKALLGERDALNTLGIDIKDSLIQDELKARGLDNLTGASRRQAEALITLDLITRQSASANEAYEKNTDSLARNLNRLNARVSEITTWLADRLRPAFSELVRVGITAIEWAVTFAKAIAAIPAFVKENYVQIGLLVGAIVTWNTQNIIAAATALKAAAAQRAATIATNAQAVAQRALNLVMSANPITRVITVLLTLAAVLVTAYQNSETFRRVVSGAFEAVTQSVKNALGFFTDLGSGLSNLFTGNFEAAAQSFSNAFNRINPAQIGKTLKESFVKGYESVPAPKAKVEADQAGAEQEGAKVGAAFAMGFEQDFKDLNSKTLSQLKKEASDLKKFLESQLLGSKEYEAAQQRLLEVTNRIKAITEENKKKAEQARKAEKEALELRLKEIEASFLKEELVTDRALFNREIKESDHAKRILELKAKQYQEQIEAFKRFNQEETKEALAAQKNLLEIQQQLKPGGVAPLAPLATVQPGQVTSQTAPLLRQGEVAAADNEIQIVKDKLARIVDLENESEILRLELKRNALNEQLELLRAAGLQETTAFQEILDEKIKADDEYNEKILSNAERTSDFRDEIEKKSWEAQKELFDATIDLLSRDENARKKNSAVIKALQIAQIQLDAIREIQGIWASVSNIPPPAGQILGGVLTAAAVIRSIAAVSKVRNTKFAFGGIARLGFFGGKPHSAGGTKGYFEDGTAIEVEKDEAFAVVNKRNAPLLRALSAINSAGGNGVPFFEKGGIPKFAFGGLPTVNTTPTGVASPQAAAQPLLGNMTDFIGAVNDFRQIVRTFPREVKSRVVYTELRDTAAEVATVEADASI